MKTFKTLLTVIFTVSALLITGCSEPSNEPFEISNAPGHNPETTGKLNVQITDAPFPFDIIEEANITISKIEGRIKDSDHQGSPFILLTETEATINIIELNNGLTETLVDNVDVPAGTYDLLRVYITEASILLKDGTFYDMRVPSGAQSGLKIFIKNNITIDAGDTGEILLDFDISKSFVPQGNPNSPNGIRGFIFKPVIKACNLNTTGFLTGSVTDITNDPAEVLEGVEIAVILADTINTTTFTNNLGMYTVLGLEPGTYTVTASKDEYSTETAEEVVISTGETVQNFELLQVETK